MKQSTFVKVLRVIAILLMGLTAAVTLLSGIGITCVALGAEKYESMAALAPYKWFYQLSVLITIGLGILGLRATIGLLRNRRESYRLSLLALIGTIIFGAIHVFVSQALRGKSMPNDLRVYLSALTLLLFLLLRLPGIWKQINLEGNRPGSEGGPAAGFSLILAGLAFLTVPLWAGPTHTWDGINYANAFHASLTPLGLVLIGAGISGLFWRRWRDAALAAEAAQSQ